MTLKIPVELTNSADTSRIQEPVTVGVPIPKSKIYKAEEFVLENSSGHRLPCHIEPMAYWVDGSIKWMLLDFQVDIDANETIFVFITESNGDKAESYKTLDTDKKIIINEYDNEIVVDTCQAIFTIDKHKLVPFNQVKVNGNNLLSAEAGQIRLVDGHGNKARSVITSTSLDKSTNPFRRELILNGCFVDHNSNELLAQFSLGLSFFISKAFVKLDFTLLNPRASKHKNGLWDLGDENSLLFKGCAIDVRPRLADEKPEIIFKQSSAGEPVKLQSDHFVIYQDSSGGENWKSNNHINRSGEVPVKFKGYRILSDGKQIAEGNRAQPVIQLKSSACSVSAQICDFWQNFPKAIEVGDKKLQLQLFPEQFSDVYELQGGEQKTHSLYLNFLDCPQPLQPILNPLQPGIPLKSYAVSGVIPFLPMEFEATAIQQLIHRGIEGDNNFFDKREQIDEYGWRNFGEIFADHEGLEYKGSEPLVSHYNNQYDPLYGMIRQYIMTGERKWNKLAFELAQHITDIDIYHTLEDRDEYNGGLFWHTDHYVSAHTCTHRTFSSRQSDDSGIDVAGGGPGTEHCYTTGLAYAYFMTGNSRYKVAALKLVDWMTVAMEGTNSILERIFKFKSQDIPIIKALISRKKLLKIKYPLTRATGNYLTALVDAFNLTGDHAYLEKAEAVIRLSIYPDEDISLRNLDEIEPINWSYVIFLQGLAKYMEVKIQINEPDKAFIYAKDCLLHYADWIADNESPFLDKSAQLEFPNHTWVAQDLRKATVLFIASCYDAVNREKYLKAARQFREYVVEELKKEETRYYSRILTVLMQNDIQESALELDFYISMQNAGADITASYDPPAHFSIGGVLCGFLKDLLSGLKRFSIYKEKRWLHYRLKA